MKLLATVDAEKLYSALLGFPQRLLANVTRVITRMTITIQRDVKENKLSGQVLHNRTGTLRRSINREVRVNGNDVTGIVGTNVKYGAIHEYGGTIPPHLVEARNAQALRFMGRDGKWVFRRSVQIPAIQMPERSFLRTSLAEHQAELQRQLTEATIRALPGGGRT